MKLYDKTKAAGDFDTTYLKVDSKEKLMETDLINKACCAMNCGTTNELHSLRCMVCEKRQFK